MIKPCFGTLLLSWPLFTVITWVRSDGGTAPPGGGVAICHHLLGGSFSPAALQFYSSQNNITENKTHDLKCSQRSDGDGII